MAGSLEVCNPSLLPESSVALMSSLYQECLEWMGRCGSANGPNARSAAAFRQDLRFLTHHFPDPCSSGACDVPHGRPVVEVALAVKESMASVEKASGQALSRLELREEVHAPCAGAGFTAVPRLKATERSGQAAGVLACWNFHRSGGMMVTSRSLIPRVFAMAAAILVGSDVAICACPGVRLPGDSTCQPGDLLPSDFPFTFFGYRSSKFDGAGFFVRNVPARTLHDCCGPRLAGVAVDGVGVKVPSVMLCGYVMPPGTRAQNRSVTDRRAAFRNICEATSAILSKACFQSYRVCVLGDFNLRDDVPSKEFLQDMGRLGMRPALDRHIPTHEGGRGLQMIFVRGQQPVNVTVNAAGYTLSDHALLVTDVEMACGSASVPWIATWKGDGQAWSSAVQSAVPIVVELSKGLQEVLADDGAARMELRRRRSLYAVAEWSLDALAVISGHLHGLVRWKKAVRSRAPRPVC